MADGFIADKTLRFTRHARKKAAERSLDIEQMRIALKCPAKVIPEETVFRLEIRLNAAEIVVAYVKDKGEYNLVITLWRDPCP